MYRMIVIYLKEGEQEEKEEGEEKKMKNFFQCVINIGNIRKECKLTKTMC